MPIVIDEVVISVEVSNQASGGTASAPTATDDKQAVINECVERVLDILKQKEERWHIAFINELWKNKELKPFIC